MNEKIKYIKLPDEDCMSFEDVKKYIAGEFNDAEKVDKNKHIAECEFCRTAIEGLTNCNNLDRIESSMEFINDEVDQVVNYQKKVKRQKLITSLSLAASLFFIFATYTIFYIKNNNPYQTYKNVDETQNINRILSDDQIYLNQIKNNKKIQKRTKKQSTRQFQKENVKAEKMEEIFDVEEEEMVEEDIYTETIENKAVSDIKESEKNNNANISIQNQKITKTYTKSIESEEYNEENIELQSIKKQKTSITKSKANISIHYQEILELGLKHYKTKDYINATEFFEQYISKNQNNDTAVYYCAMSYIKLKKNEKAINLLQKLTSKTNGIFYQDAKWFLALTYIETKKVKKAHKILNKIIENNEKYKEDAIKIISKNN